jgi:hypothetical protein
MLSERLDENADVEGLRNECRGAEILSSVSASGAALITTTGAARRSCRCLRSSHPC